MSDERRLHRVRHPVLELLGRYGAILRAAWTQRRELAGPARLADERAFLPMALSLQDTPPHPAPRRAAWVICALFVVALAWAWWGRIDIVAVAPGRIVVSDRTKTIQPLEASIVRRVHVKDGDEVEAGKVLVELDATVPSADGNALRAELAEVRSEEARTAALQAALREQHEPALGAAADARSRSQLAIEWNDISAKLGRFEVDQAHRRAEMNTVREMIAKLESTLPLAQQREADFRRLTEQGFISGHARQDRTRERIELERDLAMQRARLVEAQTALKGAERARVAYVAETQRALVERNSLAALKARHLTQELSKAQMRSSLTQLAAPVAGTVQQVAVHTEGGVVTPAQVLMVIVPKDADVTAEVAVDNRDIGFVSPGDAATVKLETFPFTRYGTVPARVARVSADAVHDEKRGSFFLATLTLDRPTLEVEGRTVRLGPGMNLSAEIKTGQRRVIDFLLSPIVKAGRESLGER
jgi:hemolysin D